MSGLKKTDNRHYQHHQRCADIFIVNLKDAISSLTQFLAT